MMKKILFVALSLVFVASSFAQVSGPSNVAGYVKFTAGGSGTPGVQSATPFGLPFMFWDVQAGVPQYGVESSFPSDIIGDQAAPGDVVSADRIVRSDGSFAWRNSANSDIWQDNLEADSGMVPGKAFWFANKTGVSKDIVLAGEVDNSGGYGTLILTMPASIGDAAANAYSWRDSRVIPIDSLRLLEQGFTGGDLVSSDKVVGQSGGIANYFTATTVWDLNPVNFAVEPGLAYWIVAKHLTPWTYDYTPAPVLPIVENDDEGTISRTTPAPTTKPDARHETRIKNSPKKDRTSPATKGSKSNRGSTRK